MFRRSITLLVTIITLSLSTNVFSQENNGLEAGRDYILADIVVTGNPGYNEQTIVTFTGLEKGQIIHVPGEEISAAIKKLWGLTFFKDINFYANKIEGDSIYLELNITKLPEISDVKVQGVRKGKREDILKETGLTKGKIVNENLITNTKNYIENKFKKDGYYNTKVAINTIPDSTNAVKMVINVDRGKKVRISHINIYGNEQLTDGKLRRSAMKKTKQKSFMNPYRLIKPSKFIEEEYKADLGHIIDKYKEKGYRDARITEDTVTYNPKKNTVDIAIHLEEGEKYYFGDIKYLGNTVYNNQQLNQILGIKKGDVYNGVLLQERIADPSKPDGMDLTNLYQNNGYLFSNINAVEVRTYNDTIDFEIRITEGPIAYFNNVTVVGNDRTNDHVIYRELRTRPGQKWNKEQVINTIRELGALGFFDAETISPDVKNADPATGNVDVEWHVTEKGSSQIELQGGYGGGGFIGTLGLSFNNFSMRNIFNKKSYNPLPMGDGQSLALRLQGSTYFQTYSLSFTEPWLGGKKPIQLFSSLSHSKQFSYNYQNRDVDRSRSFTISSIQVGLSKRLSGLNDNLRISHSLTFQYYDSRNYQVSSLPSGISRNLAYTLELTRDNRGANPIYPTYGSLFSVSFRLTAPYSLFNGIDYANLDKLAENKYIDSNGDYLTELPTEANPNPDPTTDINQAVADPDKMDQMRYNWLEYYKIKFKGDVYTKLYDKLVLRSLVEFGFLGAYNDKRGLVPYERFYLGGSGLANYSLDGREVIQLRGYPDQSLAPYVYDESVGYNVQVGGTIYNKYSLELRYPITLKPQASIYALAFGEAGSSFASFTDYEPFQLKRSAGFGLRVFMPAFGLLGIDFGYGFDPIYNQGNRNGWETHFIIGQQF